MLKHPRADVLSVQGASWITIILCDLRPSQTLQRRAWTGEASTQPCGVSTQSLFSAALCHCLLMSLLNESGVAAGELWTDAENQTTMHQLLSEFYHSALSSLERQINNKDGSKNPEGRAHLLLTSQSLSAHRLQLILFLPRHHGFMERMPR